MIASTLFLAHTCPFVQFFTFGKLRDGVATAEGMPACELELLRIYTSEVIAYIIARVIVGQPYLDADNEVHFLLLYEVGSTVRNIVLRHSHAQSILVGTAVHSLSRMVCSCALAQSQMSLLVTHSSEQSLRLTKV